MGVCSYINDNGQMCGGMFQLHEVYFRDPIEKRNRVFTELCKWHYDKITGNIDEEVKAMQMKHDNMWSTIRQQKAIAKQYDSRWDDPRRIAMAEDLRSEIKRIRTDSCRNYFCKATLSRLGKDSKFFSVHTFKPSGKRHHTYYFCSLKCFNIIKGMCGIRTTFYTGQTTLTL